MQGGQVFVQLDGKLESSLDRIDLLDGLGGAGREMDREEERQREPSASSASASSEANSRVGQHVLPPAPSSSSPLTLTLAEPFLVDRFALRDAARSSGVSWSKLLGIKSRKGRGSGIKSRRGSGSGREGGESAGGQEGEEEEQHGGDGEAPASSQQEQEKHDDDG